MSTDWLRALLVLNALTICGFALAAWGADVLPLALMVAVVAAMVTQIALVARPRRPAAAASAPPSASRD